MELFLHNKISEEQTLWWNLYSVTMYMSDISLRYAKLNPYDNFILRETFNGNSTFVLLRHY